MDQSELQEVNHNFTPIFILGMHRSGTTWVHRMLNLNGQFSPLTAARLFELKGYSSEEITKFPDRGIDLMPVSPEYPEEYSHYLEFLGRGFGKVPWTNVFNYQILSSLILNLSQTGVPLLDNPNDFSQTLFIKSKFPDAKFVFVHRNPIDIINSMYYSVQKFRSAEEQSYMEILTTYALFIKNPLLNKFILDDLNNSISIVLLALTVWDAFRTYKFLKNLSRIPRSDFIEVKYENLCQDSELILKQIFSSLNIKRNNELKVIPVNRRFLPMAKPVKSLQPIIEILFKKYIELYNY